MVFIFSGVIKITLTNEVSFDIYRNHYSLAAKSVSYFFHKTQIVKGGRLNRNLFNTQGK